MRRNETRRDEIFFQLAVARRLQPPRGATCRLKKIHPFTIKKKEKFLANNVPGTTTIYEDMKQHYKSRRGKATSQPE